MIEVRDLRKEYGGFVAVEGTTFDVAPGEVFGVVGPNGAGKTTTLKTLAGLLEPTSGTARVAGYDAAESAVRARLGFLPEESPLYEEMTPLSYLRFFADLYDVPRDVADDRIGETLDRLELDHRERPLGDMSKGMKRKVAIARSLVNDPDVLVYDEPASGLDPLTTNYVVEFTRELADEGKTVVFSAHNLYHVESVCDRIAIMNRGRIVAQGGLSELRERHGHTEYRVFTTVAVPGAVRRDGHYLRVVESMASVEATRAAAEARGGAVADIRTVEPSLERLFLDLARRDDEIHGDDGGRRDAEVHGVDETRGRGPAESAEPVESPEMGEAETAGRDRVTGNPDGSRRGSDGDEVDASEADA